MAKVNETMIKLYKGGTFSDLREYLDRRIVKPIPYTAGQLVSPSGATFALIDDTVLSGTIAVGTTSTDNAGGVQSAALGGLVGTAATTNVVDGNGAILNLVDIRTAATNEEVKDTDERKIWGLIQNSNTVTDGDAIGGVGSENLQISFVKFDASDALALVSLGGTFEFQVNKLYAARNLPVLMKEGGIVEKEVLDIAAALVPSVTRRLVVTTAYAADEVININTGAGSVAGAATPSGDTVGFPASAALFNSNGKVFIFRNGKALDKGTIPGSPVDSDPEAQFSSTTTFKTKDAIDIGEVLVIITPSSY